MHIDPHVLLAMTMVIGLCYALILYEPGCPECPEQRRKRALLSTRSSGAEVPAASRAPSGFPLPASSGARSGAGHSVVSGDSGARSAPLAGGGAVPPIGGGSGIRVATPAPPHMSRGTASPSSGATGAAVAYSIDEALADFLRECGEQDITCCFLSKWKIKAEPYFNQWKTTMTAMEKKLQAAVVGSDLGFFKKAALWRLSGSLQKTGGRCACLSAATG
jgi:hypothetical protein